jgi:hypothetical protein
MLPVLQSCSCWWSCEGLCGALVALQPGTVACCRWMEPHIYVEITDGTLSKHAGMVQHCSFS